MQYTCEIVVDLPRARVLEIFDDPDNLGEWQPGLQSFERISGDAGQPGAKSRLVYDENGRRIEMVETILVRDLPEEFSATYDAPGVHNVVVNRFHDVEPGRTRWVMENEFQFTNLMMRVVGFFMRGSFPKRTQADMERFKQFAESRAG